MGHAKCAAESNQRQVASVNSQTCSRDGGLPRMRCGVLCDDCILCPAEHRNAVAIIGPSRAGPDHTIYFRSARLTRDHSAGLASLRRRCVSRSGAKTSALTSGGGVPLRTIFGCTIIGGAAMSVGESVTISRSSLRCGRSPQCRARQATRG